MIATNQFTLNHRRENRTPSIFHVVVHICDTDGQRIKLNAITDNISPGGLFMRLPYLLTPNTRLFAFIMMPNSVGLATIGSVVRTEKKKYGLSGTAVCFSQSRLLPLDAA